jgi:hypothetical protein
MKKTLQILVGLLLILLLAYFAFLDVSEKRKSDLRLSEVKAIESEKNLTEATVEVQEIEEKTKIIVETNLTQIPLATTPVILHKEKEHVIETAPIKTIVEKTITPTPSKKIVIETETINIPQAVKSNSTIPSVVKVPVAIQNSVNVPTPVKAVTAPIAVQIPQDILKEINEKIELKTKGVE